MSSFEMKKIRNIFRPDSQLWFVPVTPGQPHHTTFTKKEANFSDLIKKLGHFTKAENTFFV